MTGHQQKKKQKTKSSTGAAQDKIRRCLLSQAERELIFQRLAAAHPHPQSELNFKNPFELLCAVVLSAQATDASVNKATPALFAAAPDAGSMAALGEEKIASYIKTIGLWHAKASYLAKLSQSLVDHYGGEVPADYSKLIKLPGVGSKTAKVVLNVAFGQSTVAVDTHIFRVANRTGLCLGKNAREVEEHIVYYIPPAYLKEAHHYLLLHGRYVCKALKPDCAGCLLSSVCRSHQEAGLQPLNMRKGSASS